MGLRSCSRLAVLPALVAIRLLVPSSALAASGWSASAVIDSLGGSQPGLNSVSCAPGTSFCAAVDDQGNVVTSSDPAAGAGAWSAPATIDPGSSLTSVSCPSRSFCAAVDNQGRALTSTDPAGGASAWPATSVDTPGQNPDCGTAPCAVTSVSCPSTSFCMAVDDAEDALTYNGSWKAPERTPGYDGGFDRLNSVSCALSNFCMAVDSAGNAEAFSGDAWSAQPNIDPGTGLSSVSCPAGTFCAAGDNSGSVLVYSYGAWAQTPVSFGPRSASCPSVGFCVAVGSSGSAVTYGQAPPPTSAHTLTVKVVAEGGASGAVDWAGGDCAARNTPRHTPRSATCMRSFTTGVKLTLRPVPGRDSVFVGWSTGCIPPVLPGPGVAFGLVGCPEDMSHDQGATALFACGFYLRPPRQALHRGVPVSVTIKQHGLLNRISTVRGSALLRDLRHPRGFALGSGMNVVGMIWRIRTAHGIRLVASRRVVHC